MFRIKICGVTTVEDASAAMNLGADMIGLNFYPKSPRYVSPEQARLLAAAVPQTTGVFVNATAAEINSIAADVGLDWVQLHGDEPPEMLSELRNDLPIIRVYSLDEQGCLGEQGLAAIVADLAACRAAGRLPDAVLVDATVPGEYGGTGKTADWLGLDGYRESLGGIPLVLAGGLHPKNITQAITTVSPSAVDTASGVEASPGLKDHGRMQSFIRAAQSAFGQA